MQTEFREPSHRRHRHLVEMRALALAHVGEPLRRRKQQTQRPAVGPRLARSLNGGEAGLGRGKGAKGEDEGRGSRGQADPVGRRAVLTRGRGGMCSQSGAACERCLQVSVQGRAGALEGTVALAGGAPQACPLLGAVS